MAASGESKGVLALRTKVVRQDAVIAGYVAAWESDRKFDRALVVDINPLIPTSWDSDIFSMGTMRVLETELHFAYDAFVRSPSDTESSDLVQRLMVAVGTNESAIMIDVSWQEIRLGSNRGGLLLRDWCCLW